MTPIKQALIFIRDTADDEHRYLIRDTADDEHRYSAVGTEVEVALRHIARKAREALKLLDNMQEVP